MRWLPRIGLALLVFLALLAGVGAVGFFLLSMMFRLRGSGEPEESDKVTGAS